MSVGDRVTIAKNLPATPWVEANGLERAVITGDHRKAGAAGTVEYLTRGLKGAFSVKVRHDDGNLAPYLVNELDDVCAMAAPADSSDWLSWAVEVWNRRVPVGAPVALTEDNGSITKTATRSEAWHLGDGTPVVKVDGRTGGYLLRRIRPIGPIQVTEGDASLVQRMRDCLLELAGESEESETIPELIQRVRETVRRPAQIAMDLARLEPEQLADVASGMQSLGADEHPAAGRIAAGLEELAAHGSGEQSAPLGERGEKLCFKHRPLHDCAAAGGDCDGCDEERAPGGPGQRGAKIRAQAKRGTIAEQLWEACDAWERARQRWDEEPRVLGVVPSLTRASDHLASVIRQIREHANPEQFARADQDPARRWYERAEELRAELEADRSALAELLRETDPDWHPDGTSMIDHLRRLLARTDIAQVVGRLVALEAAVFDRQSVKQARAAAEAERDEFGMGFLRRHPDGRVEQSKRSLYADFAIALGVESWDQPGELVAATEQLGVAHHKLVRGIAEAAAAIAGVVHTPVKLWRKKALYCHLQAVQRDLQRAAKAAEKGGAACPD